MQLGVRGWEVEDVGTGDETALLVDRAKQGDAAARDQILGDFVPFIVSVASKRTGRYLRMGVDEEVSVALTAFNQAIDAYQGGRGSFVRFAQTVIHHRLADHWRRRPKAREWLWSELEAGEREGEAWYPVLDGAAQALWQVEQEDEEWRQEIAEYQESLEAYGLRFDDLLVCGPKHRDARARAMAIAERLMHDPEMRRFVTAEKALPMKRMVARGWGSRKTLERHRKYIIAIAVMSLGEWPHLQSFLTNEGEEGGS